METRFSERQFEPPPSYVVENGSSLPSSGVYHDMPPPYDIPPPYIVANGVPASLSLANHDLPPPYTPYNTGNTSSDLVQLAAVEGKPKRPGWRACICVVVVVALFLSPVVILLKILWR